MPDTETPSRDVDTRPCETCGNDGPWHAQNETAHPYEPEPAAPGKAARRADPLESAKEKRERQAKERRAGTFPGQAVGDRVSYRQRDVPTDPALRLLLVQKGIISAEELGQVDDLLANLMGAGQRDGLTRGVVAAPQQSPAASEGPA